MSCLLFWWGFDCSIFAFVLFIVSPCLLQANTIIVIIIIIAHRLKWQKSPQPLENIVPFCWQYENSCQRKLRICWEFVVGPLNRIIIFDLEFFVYIMNYFNILQHNSLKIIRIICSLMKQKKIEIELKTTSIRNTAAHPDSTPLQL